MSKISSDVYILNSRTYIKPQLQEIAGSSNNDYIINSYRANKDLILSKKFIINNLYGFISELCKKSKHEVLHILFKEIDIDIKEKKIAKSLKDLLSYSYSLLNNAVWLSKSDSKIFDLEKKEKDDWIENKIEDIIKTITVIINEHTSQIIFNKIIVDDQKNEKTIKESFLDALLDPFNGFNKNNDYTYSRIIYDRLTRNFSEIFNIKEDKLDKILNEIDNKISDSTLITEMNKNTDILFLEERNNYFNDWACFLMSHYRNKYVDKIIKTIIISKTNEDKTVDIYIKRLLLKPSNTEKFKRYFEYFFDSNNKINEYYTNIVRYVIFDIYSRYLEALNLYDMEINECLNLEKEGLSLDDIEGRNLLDNFKNTHNNMFYDAFKYDKNYMSDPFIKDEINEEKLYSGKIRCVYKYLIKKMSIQFYKIFGFFYKNNFLKEDIIKIIMKNNFKYTNIKFMKEFIKYSGVLWNDNCNYHKNMMILFKKKYEPKLESCDRKTFFGYEELFKIYNKIESSSSKIVYDTVKIDKSIKSSKEYLVNEITKLKCNFIPIVTNSRLMNNNTLQLEIENNMLNDIDEIRIGTITPFFNRQNVLFSPASSSGSLASLEECPLHEYDNKLLKLFNKLNYDDILYYINNVMKTDNNFNDTILITFLHSLENYKINDLSGMKNLINLLNDIIKINKHNIENIFIKYNGLKDDLKIDNPQIIEKLNVLLSV
jgi:hypothetical protein